ncbi:MAG: transporter substrate-binding domain-containing protein [Thermodesulfobacteriota bacterium]
MKISMRYGLFIFEKNRRVFPRFCLVSMTLLLLAFAGSSEAVEDNPAFITSAAEFDYPPFSLVDEQGKAGGFSVELMQAALGAMGHKAAFRIGPWDQVRAWLETGEIQALPLVGRTPERENIFDFTFPYMTLHGAIVVREGTTDIHVLDDLRDRSVAVMKGDNAEEFLRREDRGVDIHTTVSFEEALRELSRGRFDAVVIQRLVALRLLQKTGLTNLRIINQPVEGFRQDFCFAVREGDRETLALLNEGLALVMADGTYRHLHAKWFAALELPTGRRIVIGGDHNYPPYEYLDEKGRPAGYNVELTRAIARAVGLDIEFRLGVWNEILEALRKGEIDAVQGMFYSPERDLMFDFSQPHTVSQYVTVLPRGERTPPDTLKDLARYRRIAVQRGDVVLDLMAKEVPIDQVILVDTQEDVLRSLAEKKADCGIVVRVCALNLIEKRNWSNLQLGRKPLFSFDYCYAVPAGHKALLASLSEGLRIIDENAEYRRIHDKWLGVYQDHSIDAMTVLQYAVIVIVPLIVVLLVNLVWTWTMRRKVGERTAELAAVSERNRAILDAAPDIIMEVDADKIYTWANPAGYAFFGSDVIGKTAASYFVGEQDTYQKVDALFNGNENVIYVESWQRRQDGRERLLAWWCRVLKDTGGRVIGGLSTARDITDSKRMEETLRDREMFMRAMISCSPMALYSIDLSGNVSSWNASAERIFGWTAEEVLGRPLPIISEENRLEFEALKEQVTAGRGFVGKEMFRLRKDGSTFPIRLSAAPIRNDDGEIVGIMGAAEDISEQKKLSAQLLQAQKMESVGRLAGGVAHDFNNMLNVIQGYAALALDGLTPDDPFHEDFSEIYEAARRSSDITRQLLAFARMQPIRLEAIDLNETVEAMLKMLRRLIGEDIELVWRPGAGLWAIIMDSSQIDQILANLLVNARDAIDGNGKVVIETGNVHLDEDACADRSDLVPGDYVLLSVSDDGCGMDKEAMDKLFEPFFTTKGLGHGTGLGLATVYGIIRQNNGFINVYSEPGLGATFKIYLPRHRGEAKTAEDRVPAEIYQGRGETVLVVEDEKAVLRLAEKILSGLGYTVLAASGPAQAMKRAGEYAGTIDLLITDVVMPEMNGRELAEKLRGTHPGIKVLYMSGYTADVIANRGILEAGVHFIQKPFTRNDLAMKVREALGNAE